MRLRNKKTGEIVDFKIIADYDDYTSGWRLEKQDGSVLFYDHIDEIKKEWEDYKPAEPLIKDEKIRKAVRAWAEANNLSGASTYKSCSDSHYWYIRAFDDTEKGIDIDIWGELPKELIDCKYYTIAELCGEEEE